MHAQPLQPDTDLARKLKIAARAASRHLPEKLPPVLVLTDPDRTGPVEALAERIPRGGGLVYRHFGVADAGEIALKLAKIARSRRFRLLIGADPQLARAIGADGVHWPERLIGRAHRSAAHFALNTVSAHSPSAISGPQPRWADARILSTVFPSRSPSAGAPLGATRFRLAVKSATLPVYALGGVSASNARCIADVAGLAGVSFLDVV